MTAKIVDHADAIKYNEKDDGRTYGRNKPVSLSLIVWYKRIHGKYNQPAAESANLEFKNDADFAIICIWIGAKTMDDNELEKAEKIPNKSLHLSECEILGE